MTSKASPPLRFLLTYLTPLATTDFRRTCSRCLRAPTPTKAGAADDRKRVSRLKS